MKPHLASALNQASRHVANIIFMIEFVPHAYSYKR